MNCKAGDMAIIIRTSNKRSVHIGKSLTCVRLLTDRPNLMNPRIGPVWITDLVLPWIDNYTKKIIMHPWCPDEWLMPIPPLNDLSFLEHCENFI